MQAKNNRKWMIGFVATAALAGVPVLNSVVPQQAARAESVQELRDQVTDCEKEMRDQEARYSDEVKSLRGNNRGLKAAKDRHEKRMGELRTRRDNLKAKLDNRRDGQTQGQIVQNKLDGLNEQIAAENERHQRAMKNIPAGSMAAVNENQKHEDKLRELNAKREDAQQDRQANRELRGSKQEFKKDVAGLKRELDAEEERHKKAMKFLPAYSNAAQEEDRFHAQKVREINDKFEQAGGQRDVKVAEVRAERQFDGELDQVKAQMAEENTTYDRRMREMNAGSQAAADERARHSRAMASLQTKQQDLLRRQSEVAGRSQRAFELRKQMDEVDSKLAAEADKHNRLMNEFDAGSQQVALENDRYEKATSSLRTRKSQLQGELASLEGGSGSTASGR